MKNIRFTLALIISAFLSTGSTYTMLPSKKQLLAGMRMAIEVALGNVPRQRIDEVPLTLAQPPINEATLNLPQLPIETIKKMDKISLDMPELPKEVAIEIRNLAIMGSSAQSLKELGYIINSLSQVNKDFNKHINDPAVSLHIIKSLAHRFNSSYADACNALQTKAAQDMKERMLAQDELLKFILKDAKNAIAIFQILNQLKRKNVDFNFIYTEEKLTPLMQTIILNNAQLVAALLELGADPTIPNGNGVTPLELAKEIASEEIVKYIEDAIRGKN